MLWCALLTMVVAVKATPAAQPPSSPPPSPPPPGWTGQGYSAATAVEWCLYNEDIDGRNGCASDEECLQHGRNICDTDPNCLGIAWYTNSVNQPLKICRDAYMAPKTDGWRTMMKQDREGSEEGSGEGSGESSWDDLYNDLLARNCNNPELNQFKCADYDCIDKSQVCDRKKDCGYGEDEILTECDYGECEKFGGIQNTILKACCPAECGKCGGDDCDKRPGGPSKCCSDKFPNPQVCGPNQNAPCILPNNPPACGKDDPCSPPYNVCRKPDTPLAKCEFECKDDPTWTAGFKYGSDQYDIKYGFRFHTCASIGQGYCHERGTKDEDGNYSYETLRSFEAQRACPKKCGVCQFNGCTGEACIGMHW